MIKSVSILGFRGFSEKQLIEFALPTGICGSGLTIIVGSNNSGKTTITEIFRYLNPGSIPMISFSVGKRNKHADSRLEVEYEFDDDKRFSFRTVDQGGSQIEIVVSDLDISSFSPPFVVPSRRNFGFEFGGNHDENSRENYVRNTTNYFQSRTMSLQYFETRVFQWIKKREKFNLLLSRILGYELDWHIDKNDNDNYFIAFKNGSHTSEGIGDGIWSVFTIVDSLYDSEKGSVIVIDEPELSIHPEIQKRILDVIVEMSAEKQIIISTHSPYFVSWQSIYNGAYLIRVLNTGNSVIVNQLNNKNVSLDRTTISQSHPHTFGINANETFFMNDNVILVEGQEDIVCFRNILPKLERNIENYNFFGWGANGASNMIKVIEILKLLGYKKVIAIFDCDELGKAGQEIVINQFSEYLALLIPTFDIRDKFKYVKSAHVGENEMFVKKEIIGICDKNYNVKGDFDENFKQCFVDIFDEIDEYLASPKELDK